MRESFRFAVLGDSHFVSAKYHTENGRGDDYRRYLWMTENVWPRVLAEIRAEAPAFLVQLGDLTEGPHDVSLQTAVMHEAVALLEEGCGCPAWFTRGDQEREAAFKEIVVPALRQRLLAIAGGKGRPLTTPYYAFSHGGARFIIADSMNLRPGAPQVAWLESELKWGLSTRSTRFCLLMRRCSLSAGRFTVTNPCST